MSYGTCRYGALGHYWTNEKHAKNEKLTARSKEWIAVSGKASKGWVDDGGKLERERGMGEDEFEQTVTKTKN